MMLYLVIGWLWLSLGIAMGATYWSHVYNSKIVKAAMLPVVIVLGPLVLPFFMFIVFVELVLFGVGRRF